MLLLNQFYPPDLAPTGRVLHDLARTLVARGHQVRVLCSRSTYEGRGSYPAFEARDGVEIQRLPASGFGRTGALGRLANYASFLVAVSARLLWSSPAPDLVLALTTPPFLGLAAACAARLRGTAHAHWIMDVYPDALAAHGMARRTGPVFRLLAAAARFQLAQARAVLALGPFMARRLQSYAPASTTGWVPLWGEAGAADGRAEMRTRRGWTDADLVLLYSGNMGLGHRFREFVSAAERLGPEGPVWAFAGAGPRRSELEAAVRATPRARIQLLPYAPESERAASLASGDVHLVSLSRDWQGVIVPSKVQAAFAAGRPVLFVGGEENEAAAWIRESGGGWVVPEDDVDGLLAAVEAARDDAERGRRAAAALAFSRERFDAARNTETIARRLEGVLADSPEAGEGAKAVMRGGSLRA